MATNKHAQIRYQALDKCFSNFGRKYTIRDLVEACNLAIYDFTGKQDGVRKRQVYEDIKFMESSQGWSINLSRPKEGRNVYFRYSNRQYSINQSPLNQVELTQIQDILFTLSRFRGMPQFEWIEEISNRLQSLSKSNIAAAGKIIDFEQNQFLKGLDLISPIFNAIVNKRVIEILYAPFKKPDPEVFIFHPYYLKQFNLRWFAFGLTTPGASITNIALDRIEAIKELPNTYIANNKIDFTEYFEDLIGVTLPRDAKPEKVCLLFSDERWPYIKTKPIHGSQKPPHKHDNGVEVELNIIINHELISKILGYGPDVTVLEPEHLVRRMKDHILGMTNNYL